MHANNETSADLIVPKAKFDVGKWNWFAVSSGMVSEQYSRLLNPPVLVHIWFVGVLRTWTKIFR